MNEKRETRNEKRETRNEKRETREFMVEETESNKKGELMLSFS
ncbi:hypothetical protein THOD04_30307 [Vibrio owensii]|nr:hypothetical protein THOD04_30307 [Vibrio owensii]